MIRSIKVGHLPIWINAVVPITSCLFGVVLELGIFYGRWKVMLTVSAMVIGAALWSLMSGASTGLSRATEVHLQRIIAAGPNLPPGDAQFGALLQTAFASAPGDSTGKSAVQQNRAAILAWGIAVGHPRLDDFFPPSVEFPENLTVEEFRRDFGGIGSQRYRQELGEIEKRLDGCVAIAIPKK
jgi:hypothetical protein